VSGSLLPVAVAAADMLSEQGIQTSVISFHTVKPLDKALILQEARFTKNIFTLEDHFITGGFGSAVAEVLAEANSTARFLRLGVPDRFTSVVGSQEYLLAENGLSKEEIVKTIVQHLKHKL
jgi:transketolase